MGGRKKYIYVSPLRRVRYCMFRALDDITLNFDITTPTARGKCHPNFTDEKGEF